MVKRKKNSRPWNYRRLESIDDLYESRLLEEAIKNDTFYTLEDAARLVAGKWAQSLRQPWTLARFE
jgi:hypothetical protein